MNLQSGQNNMHNKSFHLDPKSYAPFVALRYNATKATQLFGPLNCALCVNNRGKLYVYD